MEEKAFTEVLGPSGLNRIDFHALMEGGEVVDVRGGEELVEEGVAHSNLFLLLDGKVEVTNSKGYDKSHKSHSKWGFMKF